MADRDCVHGQLARVCDYCELEAEIVALRAQLEQAQALVERLRQEAQIQAMEARGANASLAECYRAATGGKGEPSNWHGAKPVVELIARQREWIEKAGHQRKCSVRAPHAATMDYKPTCDCGYAELVGAALNTKE